MADDLDESTLRDVKELITNHSGRNDPITSREISEKLGIDEPGSFPRTRAYIRYLVNEEGIPIAAHSNGYYLIENEEELDEYVANLTRRAQKIEDRVRSVLGAWEDTRGFDFQEDEWEIL